MIRRLRLHLVCLFLFLVVPLTAPAQDLDSRIYGRVTTDEGDVFEGLIRWDKNEVSWLDILNGSKRTVDSSGRHERRGRVEILGITIFEGDDGRMSSRESGLRFGHVRTLETIGSNRALLTLHNGDEVEFHGGSTDIGNDIREIIVEDPQRGNVELDWRDIDRIDFMQAPIDTRPSRFGERLFGTLTTRSGDTFRGFICWDVDEVLTEDVLDGEDESNLRREIPFGQIERLERNSSRSTRVWLRSGEEIVLRGTNDVNSSNRGILVLDPALGQVQVGWRDFGSLTFEPPEMGMEYTDFFEGSLFGTIYLRNGEKYTGPIRWDDDEAYSWELLNGELDDLEFDIEFGMVQEIERGSSRSAIVTLLDGNSNDVNSDNDGIVVLLKDGEELVVDWSDFERVVFEKP